MQYILFIQTICDIYDIKPIYLHGAQATDPPAPTVSQRFAAAPIAFSRSPKGTGWPCTGAIVVTFSFIRFT